MARITKKEREEAIEGLITLASTSVGPYCATYGDWHDPSLGYKMWDAIDDYFPYVIDEIGTWPWREQLAEAAQLLREGWCPGDPVEPRA